MKEFKIEMVEIADILHPEEVERHHLGWSMWLGHNRVSEQPQNVHAFAADDVVITKVWQYSDTVFRTGILQERLRSIDPYRTPGAGGYYIPFWHEYHYWQAGEQLYHASNRLRGHGEGEITIVPKTVFDLRKKILFDDIVSIQLIFTKRRERAGVRMEEGHYTLLNRRNEVFGQTFQSFIVTPMAYRRLWHEASMGKPGAKEELYSVVARQIRRLTRRFGRTVQSDFLPRLQAGEMTLDELDQLLLFFR